MIQEAAVLLGVEHLEESAGGVSVVSLADLVDFVDDDNGVLSGDLEGEMAVSVTGRGG